jgi:hypothetical protein
VGYAAGRENADCAAQFFPFSFLEGVQWLPMVRLCAIGGEFEVFFLFSSAVDGGCTGFLTGLQIDSIAPTGLKNLGLPFTQG